MFAVKHILHDGNHLDRSNRDKENEKNSSEDVEEESITHSDSSSKTQRKEINFRRLLGKCYQTATSTQGIPETFQYKFNCYLMFLQENLEQLEAISKSEQSECLLYPDDIPEYARKIAFISKIYSQSVSSTPSVTLRTSTAKKDNDFEMSSKEHSSQLIAGSKVLANIREQLFHHSPQQAVPDKILDKVVRDDMLVPLRENLGKEQKEKLDHTIQQDVPQSEPEKVRLLQQQEEIHQRLTAQMLEGTELLRENVLRINESLRTDSLVLEEAEQSGEENLSHLQDVSGRLKEFVSRSASDCCSSYFQMAFVIAVFFFMVFFIRMIPRPKYEL